MAKVGGESQTEICTLLMASNFLLAIPYLIIGASGTRDNIKMLLSVFLICTVELLMWLGLILFAVISVENVHDLLQWIILTVMVSLLFMCWTLLLMAWKRRRMEEVEATFTATLLTSSIVEVKEEEEEQRFREWNGLNNPGIIEIAL